MKLIDVYDIEQIMDHMEAMREESPVLRSVPVDRGRTAAFLLSMIQYKHMVGVVAEGGCMLVIISDNFYDTRLQAFEQMFYVRPEYRGKRLAVQMVRTMEQVCSERGAETLLVGSSTGIADERTALLYERLGYRRSGIQLRKELHV